MPRRVLSALVALALLSIVVAAQPASAEAQPSQRHAWTETRLTSEWVGPLAGSGSIEVSSADPTVTVRREDTSGIAVSLGLV